MAQITSIEPYVFQNEDWLHVVVGGAWSVDVPQVVFQDETRGMSEDQVVAWLRGWKAAQGQ